MDKKKYDIFCPYYIVKIMRSTYLINYIEKKEEEIKDEMV